VTNLAVFKRRDRKSKFELIEVAPGLSRGEVRDLTEADYIDM